MRRLAAETALVLLAVTTGAAAEAARDGVGRAAVVADTAPAVAAEAALQAPTVVVTRTIPPTAVAPIGAAPRLPLAWLEALPPSSLPSLAVVPASSLPWVRPSPPSSLAWLAALPPPLAGPRTHPHRAWPTPGPIVARFGEPGPGFPWPGVRIGATAAASVHAPGRGRVLFADEIDEVGLVLIIDHGDEYHSVLAGLGTVAVRVGEAVATGQEIGRMAERMAERASSALNLHLELRRNGRPVDPLAWLGVRVAGDGHS